MNYPQLQQLQGDYPIPLSWHDFDTFSQQVNIGSLELSLVGLQASKTTACTVTGSAAGHSGQSLWLRSYFELLERIAIMEAYKKNCGDFFSVRDFLGQPVTTVGYSHVFNGSVDDQVWKLSLSNGVSCHTNWIQAATASIAEVVERDAILHSWYGGSKPQQIKLFDELVLAQEKLAGLYELKLFEFDSHLVFNNYDSTFKVAGFFAFPLSDLPAIYGFGADTSFASAAFRAYGECLQRLGFLWEEEVSIEEPQFAPTAEYHQEVFLRPHGRRQIEAWLAGHYQSGLTSTAERSSDVQLVDLTPSEFGNKVKVVKALVDSAIPLVFGKEYWCQMKHLNSELLSSRFIHPIV